MPERISESLTKRYREVSSLLPDGSYHLVMSRPTSATTVDTLLFSWQMPLVLSIYTQKWSQRSTLATQCPRENTRCHANFDASWTFFKYCMHTVPLKLSTMVQPVTAFDECTYRSLAAERRLAPRTSANPWASWDFEVARIS